MGRVGLQMSLLIFIEGDKEKEGLADDPKWNKRVKPDSLQTHN